ncbi:MAG: hypothetical protein ABJK39_01180 [Hyphomicrobiales bacterium]
MENEIEKNEPFLDGNTLISELVDRSWIEDLPDEFLSQVGSIAFDQITLVLNEDKNSNEGIDAIHAAACIQILFLLSKYSPTIKQAMQRAGLGDKKLVYSGRPIQESPEYSNALALVIERYSEQGGELRSFAEKIAKHHIASGERSERFITLLSSLIGTKKVRKKRDTKIDPIPIMTELHLLRKEGHSLENITTTLAAETSISERTIENYMVNESSTLNFFQLVDECIDPVLIFLERGNDDPSTLFYALLGVLTLDMMAFNISEMTKAIHEPLNIEPDINSFFYYAAQRFEITAKFLPEPNRAACANDCMHGCKRFTFLDTRETCLLFNSER